MTLLTFLRRLSSHTARWEMVSGNLRTRNLRLNSSSLVLYLCPITFVHGQGWGSARWFAAGSELGLSEYVQAQIVVASDNICLSPSMRLPLSPKQAQLRRRLLQAVRLEDTNG